MFSQVSVHLREDLSVVVTVLPSPLGTRECHPNHLRHVELEGLLGVGEGLGARRPDQSEDSFSVS